MFSSNSGRKSLLRNGSERSSMKNWPLFAFLFGLVFFFYIFYVYQVQNTEFALNREQLEIQLRQVKALKNELIDVKVELERIGVSEATAKRQYNECNTKLSDCSTSLRASKIKIENILLEKTKCEKYMGDNQSLILDLKNNVVCFAFFRLLVMLVIGIHRCYFQTELERNNTAQRMLISTQTVLLAQLNQTVQAICFQMLKTEVSVLRSGHSSSPQQSSKEVIPQNKNVDYQILILYSQLLECLTTTIFYLFVCFLMSLNKSLF
uniref:Uncharacterized protein n=1 Tax=Heterorhabditis bacteriophora TaxID=37862 RepID=A0A1I7WS74_HETBA